MRGIDVLTTVQREHIQYSCIAGVLYAYVSATNSKSSFFFEIFPAIFYFVSTVFHDLKHIFTDFYIGRLEPGYSLCHRDNLIHENKFSLKGKVGNPYPKGDVAL